MYFATFFSLRIIIAMFKSLFDLEVLLHIIYPSEIKLITFHLFNYCTIAI